MAAQLKPVWPNGTFAPGDMLDVELGLFLLGNIMPGSAATDAWTLFGGYPYAEGFGFIQSDAQGEAKRLMIRRGRHYLWALRRRRVWLRALKEYQSLPQDVRGYDVVDEGHPPALRSPSRAADRFEHYRLLLETAPPFEKNVLPIAQPGEYWFPVRDRKYSVTFTEDLADGTPAIGHDLEAQGPNAGRPITVTLTQLREAAREMDSRELANPAVRPNRWVSRFDRIELLVHTQETQRFERGAALSIGQVLHLVGMVGAGKSTLRDVLGFWCATQGLKLTIVVGDVAEALSIVETFANLKVEAAPIIGHSTRERHIQRLHRRLASGGAPSMLAHEHRSFDHLNSACPTDALRGLEATTALRISEAPCTKLYPASTLRPDSPDEDDDVRERAERRERPKRHGCPLWARCPRHHSARELVTASIWVATPASLIHSGVPAHQTDAVLRYLELAARRSDLIIVDEADRVQMQLDAAFAPATTLIGRGRDSWLDEIHRHKISELAQQGRLQLSQQFIAQWINAFNTVTIAADCLYELLTTSKHLRKWITTDFFSAHMLHQALLNAWFPQDGDDAADDEDETGRRLRRDSLNAILDTFRDRPLEPSELPPTNPVEHRANELVALTLRLLHSRQSPATRKQLRDTLLALVESDPRIASKIDQHELNFEFTLMLAVLHDRLDFVTTVWPRVEAALNLDSASNVMSRRPPKDYEPVVAESPMGNILGFQFQPDDQQRDGSQSGALRFFRCNGLGRDLLLNLHDLPTADGRSGPNVLLMSATSWAGTSSRFHLHHPVGAVLRPHASEMKAILNTSFRKEFLYSRSNDPLRVSGTDREVRPHVIEQMLRQLAEPDRSLTGATSKFEDELADIADPERRRILVLVGSYDEAKFAAEVLNKIPEWSGRVIELVSDDTDLDEGWQVRQRKSAVGPLRRGDIASFSRTAGEILVAPLLAVERGHNIVLPDGRAAIGTVYFLVRPHPHPNDLTLAIQAMNDWAVRFIRGGNFRALCQRTGSPDTAGQEFRREARIKWRRFLTRRLSWSSLRSEEKKAFAWDQMVVMWQVIGRLIRGGVPARVVFVDAAFAPKEAAMQGDDTPDTSLLLSMQEVLRPYFDGDSTVEPLERSLVEALYEPFFQALCNINC